MEKIYKKILNSLTKLIIFGLGENSKNLIDNLISFNIKVDFLCDNDIDKQGTFYRGIECKSLKELEQYKDESTVLISIDQWDLVIDDIKSAGFKEIYLNSLMEFMPPKGYENLKSYRHFGHYYSLYPDIKEITNKENSIFVKDKPLLGIDLNENNQLKLFESMKNLYLSAPKWEKHKSKTEKNKFRYFIENGFFGHSDALGLHYMLRILQPKNVIEVGSGFSSAVMLDTNEFYLNNSIHFTFIEPYPDRLKSLLKPAYSVSMIKSGLQDVPVDAFEKLQAGDILFIDSTHVSKINSDVNYLIFEILPRLNHGVIIHFHDIFYPFEYPREWIMEGRIWNEIYLLRGFLQNNKEYEILFFVNMFHKKYENMLKYEWCFDKNSPGGSIWIRKL